jgi:hypothetical protein
VTATQRARLIVALGVVNVVLATLALGLGGMELRARSAAPDSVAEPVAGVGVRLTGE